MVFNRRTLMAFVAGICATLAVMWVYRMFLLEKSTPYSISINVTDSILGKVKVHEIVKELNQSEDLPERINSVNKRIDDVLIFGGIIVTLLLAINVGVYVKAESEVERHFQENFESVRKRMEAKLVEIEQMAAKAKTEFATIQKLKNKSESSAPQTQIPDNDGQ